MAESSGSKSTFLLEVPTPWILKKRRRLFSIFFITLALPMAAFTLLLTIRIHHYLERQAIAQTREAAKLSAQVIKEHFGGLIQYTEIFTDRRLLIRAIEEKNEAEVRRHLQDFVSHNSHLDRVFISDPKGIELYDYPQDPAVIGKDFSYRDWYKGIVKTQKTYISEVYQRAAVPKTHVIAISSPIKNTAGQLLGYVVAQSAIETFAQTLASNRPSFAGSLYVIDHHGYLAGRLGANEGPPVPLGQHPVIRQLLAAKEGFLQAIDPLSEKPSFMSSESLPAFNWTVVAVQPLTSVREPEKKLRWMVIGFAVPSFILMFAFGFLWIGSIDQYHRVRRCAENIIIQKTDDLARSETEREQMKIFAHAATHDLQEPLHKIQTFSNYLKSTDAEHLTAKGLRYLDCVQEAATGMSHMMEKLREMARVNSEKSVSEKIDLGELIRKLLVEMEVPHPDGKDRIILGEMPILQANPVYLQVLFRNLIENALKFRTNNSAVEIDIQSRAINKEMFEITVRDNGIGFENQYAEYIFEPFKRLHTHQNYPGSGMGLTLCQAIVKHYRGNIKASGSPGEGSVFTILLPRLQKESS